MAAASLVVGASPSQAVSRAVSAMEDRPGGEELEFLVGAAGVERPIDGPDQGFVLFTTGVALRSLADARPFEEGLRSVVALGGDTDTNAAVAGALLGTLHGLGGLPAGWLERLADRRAIEDEALELAAVTTA